MGEFWKRVGSYLVLSPQEVGKLVSPTKNNTKQINIRRWLTLQTNQSIIANIRYMDKNLISISHTESQLLNVL